MSNPMAALDIFEGMKALNFAASCFRCPITERRLDAAISIVPCGCKINKEVVAMVQVAAKRSFDPIFFEAVSGSCCPLCKKIMFGYHDDHKTRLATMKFFHLAERKESFKMPKERPGRLEAQGFNYPGERGYFLKLGGKDFTDFTEPKDSIPYGEIVILVNTNPNSILEKISFVVIKNQGCTLTIDYKPSKEFITFLRSNNFQFNEDQASRYNYIACESPCRDASTSANRLLELLVTFNDFHAWELAEMRRNIRECSDLPMLGFNSNVI